MVAEFPMETEVFLIKKTILIFLIYSEDYSRHI